MQEGGKEIYNEILKALITFLNEKGIEDINANMKGFKKPKQVKWVDKDKEILPDLTIEIEGVPYVFEVGKVKDDMTKEIIDRWKLLSAYVKQRQGKFYMVVPEKNEEEIKEKLSRLEVSADILSVKGV